MTKEKEKFICKKPGKKSLAVIARDRKVISPSMTREYDFIWRKAQGCYVWDLDGRKYLDFGAAVAVAAVGHTNPSVIKAVQRQLRNGTHAAFPDFYNELPVRFVETLLKFVPSMEKAFLSNSGTESIEAALKLARWYTKKSTLIAFAPSFHGRTMGSLSLTSAKPVHKDRFGPFLDVKHAPYPYCYRCPFGGRCDGDSRVCSSDYLSVLEKVIKSCKGNAAGIFFEPVAGEPGYIVPPKEFVVGMRKLASEHGLLLCADEVQSGCYRTGKFLAIENFGVKADIVSLSKAVGGGFPLGVTLASSRIMSWPSGAHANTFGGNLAACAAGLASLEYMKKHKLGENASRIGAYMRKRLLEMKQKFEIVGDVRGIGLMQALEIVENKRSKAFSPEVRSKILCKAVEKGLILLPAGKSAIRICPPLIITTAQAEHGLDVLEESIKIVSRK